MGPILDGTNMCQWLLQAIAYLRANHVWRVYTVPPPADSTNSVNATVLASHYTAKGAWDALLAAFATRDSLKAAAVTTQLSQLKYAGEAICGPN